LDEKGVLAVQQRAGLHPVLYVASYLGCFYLVGSSAVKHWNIPLSASWPILGDAAGRMKFILVVSPLIGMFAAMALSAALLLSGTVKPGSDAVKRVALTFILTHLVVFCGMAWILVGSSETEAWVGFLGKFDLAGLHLSRFYTTFLFLCPASGVAGVTMLTMLQKSSDE
jgi:hypothetical protein